MRGGLVAGTLFVLPGVVALMVLSWLYAGFGEIGVVKALFFGLTAAVLAVVLEAVVKVGKRALQEPHDGGARRARLRRHLLLRRAVPDHRRRRRARSASSAMPPASPPSGRRRRTAARRRDEAPAAIDAAFARAIPAHVRPSARRAVKVAVIGLTLWLAAARWCFC